MGIIVSCVMRTLPLSAAEHQGEVEILPPSCELIDREVKENPIRFTMDNRRPANEFVTNRIGLLIIGNVCRLRFLRELSGARCGGG